MDKIKLSIKNEVFKQYITEERDVLNDISKINIFVGANNSGKSRFLREIYKMFTRAFHLTEKKTIVNFFDLPFQIPAKKLIKNIEQTKEIKRFKTYSENVLKIFIKNCNYNKWQDFEKQLKKYIEIYGKPLKNNDTTTVNEVGDSFTLFENTLSSYIFDEYKEKIKNNYHTTYIPVLRSLRQTKNSETAYKDRAIKDYFADIEKVFRNDEKNLKELDVFTGEKLYSEIKELQNNGHTASQIKKSFEDIISKYFFKGQNIFIYANERKNNNSDFGKDISIKIGNEKEFPIYELGDGIQTIILYTFPLFLHKNKTHYLFIEEPEQNLHPGMQRILLEILNDEMFKNVTVFFTTHSNHLLDTTIKTSKQTSIFSFKKEKIDEEKGEEQTSTFKIENLKSANTDILNNLGVKNSSVFLANCTIWVEGITDRKYIKQFLKIYFKKNGINQYHEDLHYSFVEYAGSNIAHWDFDENNKNEENENIFAGSISNRIFLIADSDIKKIDANNIKIDKEEYFKIEGKTFEIKKWKRHKYLKDNLNDNFHRLDSKEIENLLTPEVILGAISKKENIEAENLSFSKKTNLSEIKFIGINGNEVERPVYWYQNIGDFIDKNVVGKKKNYTKDNSIKDKIIFCDKAIEYMESQEDNWVKDYDKLLSKEAQELCEKMHKFIKENNEEI